MVGGIIGRAPNIRHRWPSSITFLLGFKPKSSATPLVVLAGLDSVVQAFALWLPPPFSGIGLVGFALLPVVLVWYLILIVVILAAIPIAYLCFRKLLLAPLGIALLVLSTLNLLQAGRWYTAQQPTKAEAAERDLESRKADEVYRCLREWFSVPRRVVEVDGNELIFAGGGRIDVCSRDNRVCGGDPASVVRRQAFGRFASEHVLGADVSVTLPSRPYFRYQSDVWCTGEPLSAEPMPGFHGRYPADVNFRGKHLTVTESPPRIEDFR